MSGKAEKTKTMFHQRVSVTIAIDAPAAKVWKLLTDAADFPRWNSTVVRIDGTIAEGQKIALTAKSSDRVFNLKISDVQPERAMTWSDGMAPMFKGVRTFELTPTATGVEFAMAETFTGLMLPMIAGSLPDFVPIFEHYARDLKAAAER